jgi:hypothetical protein
MRPACWTSGHSPSEGHRDQHALAQASRELVWILARTALELGHAGGAQVSRSPAPGRCHASSRPTRAATSRPRSCRSRTRRRAPRPRPASRSASPRGAPARRPALAAGRLSVRQDLPDSGRPSERLVRQPVGPHDVFLNVPSTMCELRLKPCMLRLLACRSWLTRHQSRIERPTLDRLVHTQSKRQGVKKCLSR